MPAVTEQTLTVHDLYAMRDRIGLSRRECEQPPRVRSLYEWGRGQQASYLNDLTQNFTSPPLVHIWEPSDRFGKGAVLDGRQRLKAFFSYLDGNFRRKEIVPGEWVGKDYIQLLAAKPFLTQVLRATLIHVFTIQAPSYWEAAIAVYPQICGYRSETAEREQQILQSYLDNEDDIFTDNEYCDWRVSNLKMMIAYQKRTAQIEFRCTERGRGVLVPQFPPHGISTMIAEWQLRATELVARHHHRGAIPC